MLTNRISPHGVSLVSPVYWFLAVEFIDELVDGFEGTAWPAIKTDLDLSLAQIGLLLGLPRLLGNIIEAPLGLLADALPRRRLIATGGLAFALALSVIGSAPSFLVLLVGMLLFNPASGAFVSISQATLMDMAPERREQNMARWSLAGTLGNLLGPLLCGAAFATGIGWRPGFGLLAGLALLAVVTMKPLASLQTDATPNADIEAAPVRLADSLKAAWRQGAVRWLALLECSDLMLDVFRGYLALYFVEVVKADPALAALAVAVLTAASLVGGALMVPLLNKVTGISWVRLSSLLVLAVYPAFLLIGAPVLKIALAALLGLLTAGWYSVLKAGLYAQLPGRSGTALALANVGGLAGSFLPMALGCAAETWGLSTAMWLLLAAPLALLCGLPQRSGSKPLQHT